MSAISSLAAGYLQSILGLQNNSSTSQTSSTTAPSAVQKPDKAGLSPFAQLMSTLQQLQQSNPTEYQQVTQQIATNLKSAAQTATSGGNTTAANQLTQLSTDFSNASSSGQLPNVQDLAQAIGGGHHHHHFHASGDANASANSGSSSTSGNQGLSQLLSAFQTGTAQNDSLNPMNIIMNTLSGAGIGTATS